MQPKFETGQVVYDKRGNPGRYVEHRPEGHIVLPTMVMGWGDDDFDLDRTVWPDAFDKPPAPGALLGWLAGVLVLTLFAMAVIR